MASFHMALKTGKKGKAAEHAAYIQREGKYAKREDCQDLIAKGSGNLPDWSLGSSKKLWIAADKYERQNGSTYREVQVALPNELTAEQNIELVNTYIALEVGSKPFEFAIHSPIAAIGNCPQPHAHIMISDRMPDGIERDERQHFSRYNSAFPEKGGCKKDSGGKDRLAMQNHAVECRARWANLQNQFLARHGHSVRVDHRSNVARGLTSTPEGHLGLAMVNALTADERDKIAQSRAVI